MTYWDDNATPAGVFNVGDMYNEYTTRQAAFIVEQLDVNARALLDLGCGVGRLTLPVAMQLIDTTVQGVDPSWPMIREARKLYSIAPNVTFHLLDRVNLGEPTFDGAWCVLTFQHLPDHTVKQHLQDLFEILKPGARLVTQWVTHGEEGPMSYPRRMPTILHWLIEAGFIFPHFATDHAVTDYSDDWVWVTAEKPA